MICHYIHSFLRNVKKNLFFYSINLFGFFVGFLLLTIISAFVYQEFSFDRFHENSSTIYRINSGGYGVTPLCFKEKLNNQLSEILYVIQLSSTSLEIDCNNEVFNVEKAYFTDSELFQVFSFKLLSGNPENALDVPFSIVLDESTAKSLFGKQPALGKIIHGTNGDYTVTGISEDIPYNSHIQCNAFVSMETLRETDDGNAFNCGSWSGLTYVSLVKNSSIKAVEDKINVLLEDSRMADNTLKLEPLEMLYFDGENNKYDGCKHGNMENVMLYLAIVILILIIVVFNYINLSTILLMSRLKEFSVRKINGAQRKDIIGHVMLETFGMAFISSLVVLLFVEFLLRPLSGVLNISIASSLNRSSLYIFYFIGIGIICSVIGFFPGFYVSKVNEIKVFKNEGIFGCREIQRKLFLMLQLSVIGVLLNSVFIVNKQIYFMLEKDIGLKYEKIVALQLDEVLQNKNEILKDKLLTTTGVENVSFSNGLIGDGFSKVPIDITDNRELCYVYSIDPEYLTLYNIDLKYGRNFSQVLNTDVDGCCLINEEACEAIGIENPVDKIINRKRIIGVVKNFNYSSLHNVIEPLILTCEKGNVVQIKLEPANQERTIEIIKNICMGISPDFIFNYTYLDSRIKDLYKSDMSLKSSIEIYTILAFLIALLGHFGVSLFTIKKKAKEVGIRKLHGATISDTFKLFAMDQLRIIFLSNIMVIPISIFILNKWLCNFPYKVDVGHLVFLKSFMIITVFSFLALIFLIITTRKASLAQTLKNE